MKAHTHYTTPFAAMPRVRRIATTLAALLVLATVSFGLISALRLSLGAATSRAAADTRPELIAGCQACRDEALGADQASLAYLMGRATAPAAAPARRRIVGPRAFQDEVAGADQASLASLTVPDGGSFEPQQAERRAAGPR
jgi:hypothetical protein